MRFRRAVIDPLSAVIVVVLVAGGAWIVARLWWEVRPAGEHVQVSVEAEAWFNTSQPITAKMLDGRNTLLVFFATWCPPCVASMPSLNRLHAETESTLDIIAISNEPARFVGPFVEGENIAFVVAAGATVAEITVEALPHYILLDKDGRIRWEGGRLDAGVIKSLLRSGPTVSSRSPLAERGSQYGWDDRPRGAFDAYEMERVRERLLGQSSVSRQEVEELSAFYWKNLPTGSQGGDDETRKDAVYALARIGRRFRDSLETVECVRSELLRQVSSPDPSPWNRMAIARSIMRVCAMNDARAIAALGRARVDENDPLVLLAIQEAVEKLDPNIDPPKYPPSAFRDARTRFDKPGFFSFFGRPKTFAVYEDFLQELHATLAAGRPTPEAIRRLGTSFKSHRSLSDSDVLIRWDVIEQLGIWPNFYKMTEDERTVADWELVAIFELTEPDWEIRKQLVSYVSGVNLANTSGEIVGTRAKVMLQTEEVRDVRALLEYVCRKIGD